MSDHKVMANILVFNSLIQFPDSGNSGGIFIMWDNTRFSIQDITISPQAIYTIVKVSNPPSSWYFSVVYASKTFGERKILWNNLQDFSNTTRDIASNPWLIGGDFNEVLKSLEKFEGTLSIPLEPMPSGIELINITSLT